MLEWSAQEDHDMTDDFETRDDALATDRARNGDDASASRPGPYADDGTTLTGESESSAGTRDADPEEPAGGAPAPAE
jgi:hypothetical protein